MDSLTDNEGWYVFIHTYEGIKYVTVQYNGAEKLYATTVVASLNNDKIVLEPWHPTVHSPNTLGSL